MSHATTWAGLKGIVVSGQNPSPEFPYFIAPFVYDSPHYTVQWSLRFRAGGRPPRAGSRSKILWSDTAVYFLVVGGDYKNLYM